MSKTFFVGDLHLGHRNICKYRSQFQTPKEHDDFVIERVLSVRGKRNTLVLFGDCFFTEESLDALRLFRKSFGRIVFILGNHDTDSADRQENIKTIFRENLIDGIYSLWSYKGFWLSHAPIHSEELRGRKNVHGHTHSYQIQDQNNYRSVSLEQIDFTPIDFETIKEEFKRKDEERKALEMISQC